VKDAAADLLSAALGMSASELDALDALAAQEGAADRHEILRLIVLRELAAAGLLPASDPATNPMAEHTRPGAQPIRG
jgi:hypothetical protein